MNGPRRKPLGLKPSTLRTWFGSWRRMGEASQSKQAVKPKARKDGKAKGVKTAKVSKDNRQTVEAERAA